MDKSSLKKALIEAKEIETFAAKSAKKLMEQEFLPKVERSVRQALLEMENTEMTEASEVSLDPGASVNVTVGSDGKVTIKSADGTAPAVVEAPGTEVVAPGLPAAPVTELPGAGVEEIAPEEEGIVTPEEEEMTTPEEEEELFEIVDDAEETPVVDDETEEAPIEGGEETEEVPAEETEEEPVADEEVPGEEDGEDLDFGGEAEVGGEEDERLSKIETDMEEMKGLLEKILEKVGEAEEGEGDVEIVADEPTEEVPGEEEFGGEEVPAEEESFGGEEEEVMFEFDDVLDETGEEGINMKDLEEALQEMMGADSLEEYGDEHPVTVKDALGMGEEEELNEIEIESAEEEELEEGEGISLTNRQGQNLKPNTPHKKVRSGLSESDKAQYESKLDGLTKENASLKTALKEYKDSFVVLRKQINEVQTFNAKLAYANKVFTKGGLTNEEKGIIAEQFDNCNTADEAKSLYNKLIKENAIVSKPNANKIKLPKQAASTNNSPERGALYENEETKRMKKLAGIIK